MGLQTDALSMLGLGVQGDVPISSSQPPLVDGIHLRWAFGPGRAFPWHGYYLLRRVREESGFTCIGPHIRAALPAGTAGGAGGLTPGTASPIGVNSLRIGGGAVISDAILVVTDEFQPSGQYEIDLRERESVAYLFDPGQPAYTVRYAVGLLASQEPGASRLHCVEFSREDLSIHANPRRKDGLVFTVLNEDGEPLENSIVRESEGRLVLGGGPIMTIRSRAPSEDVLLTLGGLQRGVEAVGLDQRGRAVAEENTDIIQDESPRITLSGDGIVEVRIRAREAGVTLADIYFRTCEPEPSGDGLRVRAWSHDQLLDEHQLTGSAGDVIRGSFRYDRITAIEFSGGEASLVDLCYSLVHDGARWGWDAVHDCPQPLCLPVRHPAYPCNGGLPTDVGAAEAAALSRICYGPPSDMAGGRFAALHEMLLDLVAQGPGGPPMQQITQTHVGVAGPQDDDPPPTIPSLRPLEIVTLSALHAPVSQALGLYWADQTSRQDVRYDYMIVADYQGLFGGQIENLLTWLTGPSVDFHLVDAWIVFDMQVGAPPPLPSPSDVTAFALPGGTIDTPSGDIVDATSNVGLRWDDGAAGPGALTTNMAVLYHLWRTGANVSPPLAPVPASDHVLLGDQPHLVGKTLPPTGATPAFPSDWPTLPMHFLDIGLEEGWYSYRVNGVDLFGRYSALSNPACWRQWRPAPVPEPWYFDKANTSDEIHGFAVHLLDKSPPPPPTSVEAMALDPRDPVLVRDFAYDTWFATLTENEKKTMTGLRVRWLWTYAQRRQAPDLAGFRIYWQPGQLNTLTGRITAITAAGAGKSDVATDKKNTAGVDAYAGSYLRADGRSFRILGSKAGSPLQVRVQNVGPNDTIAPQSGSDAVIAMSPKSTAATLPFRDYSKPPTWADRIRVVPQNEFTVEVVLPVETAAGDELEGPGASVTGYLATLPAGVDISGIRPYHIHLWLENDTSRPSKIYRVLAVDATQRQLALDGNPALTGSASKWRIGLYARRYEVFFPVPGDSDRTGALLTTSVAQPVAYGNIGVTAVDDKSHTADDPARAGGRWDGQKGNESEMGGPSLIFRVHRDPPAAPVAPPDSDKVYATRADYQNQSFYTYRWSPAPHLRCHIYRALDDSTFKTDWLIRTTRKALSATEKSHENSFPDGWTAARKLAAAAALNSLSSSQGYAALSTDARAVLARLPGNETRTWGKDLEKRDWELRQTRANLQAADSAYFPGDWTNPLKRGNAANELNGISTAAKYESLSVDALRVLAGLPGNERAFSQLTIEPLDPDAAAHANRLGPDNPDTFTIDLKLRAYIDTLDGRSTNRHFYRCAYIDKAGNQGPLGLSSPPVHLPDIVPPRTPVFTRVAAGDPDPAKQGDRKITVYWASNREDDLAAYWIYRTEKEDDVRDIRLMDKVHAMTVPVGATRPEELNWLDSSVKGLCNYWYRLVAVDAADNASQPSAAVAARAYDAALPQAPTLTVAWAQHAGHARARIQWTSEDEVLIQRRGPGGPWIDLVQWRQPGTVNVHDPFSDPTESYEYRARVRKYTGATVLGSPVSLSAQGS